ncbi:MAG: methylmalonyl-CoA mutase family protein, partial [Bdellovibrionales bacterium]
TLKINEKLAQEQIERLRIFKKNRDLAAVAKSLEKLLQAATINSENLMYHFLTAAENKVTLGEISDTLRKSYGLYKETVTL